MGLSLHGDSSPVKAFLVPYQEKTRRIPAEIKGTKPRQARPAGGRALDGVAMRKQNTQSRAKSTNQTRVHPPERAIPKGENLSPFGALSPISPEKRGPAGGGPRNGCDALYVPPSAQHAQCAHWVSVSASRCQLPQRGSQGGERVPDQVRRAQLVGALSAGVPTKGRRPGKKTPPPR